MSQSTTVRDAVLRAPSHSVDGLRGEMAVAWRVGWQLFRKGLQAGYRQSLLGYLWLLLPPLATAGVWIALSRTRVLQVGRTEIPYPLFVLSGTVLWQLFVDSLNAPLRSLTASRAILTKTRIPHEAVLIAGVLEALFGFAVRLAVLLPVLAWYGVGISASLLLFPLGVFSLVILGFGIGLALAPTGMLYTDVSRGLTLAAGLGYFLTPIVYPLPASGPATALGVLNPVAPLLVATRGWLTGGALLPPRGFGIVAALSAGVFALAWWGYRAARPHLVSRL
ncbi:MAG TPA: hypothetical protein VGB92_16400 [Longimicrobium sp.]|jgi:lipopolysaccharide transport system permease protein